LKLPTKIYRKESQSIQGTMISTKKKAVYTQIYLEDIMEQLEQEFEKAFGNENCDYQEILQKIKFLILKNYFKGGKS
jgi:hypothetical protein